MNRQFLDKSGPLDGLTILRFAHAFESGGGVEQHLYDLNRVIGQRNRVTTIQMQLAEDAHGLAVVDREVGKSRLITVPLLAEQYRRGGTLHNKPNSVRWSTVLLEHALNALVRSPAANRFVAESILRRRHIPRRLLDAAGAAAKAKEIIDRWNVDLVVLHTSGSRDALEIAEVTRNAGIPLCLVHHFSNRRLWGLSLRRQVASVDAVGGASSVGVPNYLKSVYWNLSDAVDTEFFSRTHAFAVDAPKGGDVLYAPGRVTPEKGQMDVLNVASILKERGLKPKVVFAGRIDSAYFLQQLKDRADATGLSDSVIFLGALSLTNYRDWYCAADVMLMPTRHHEGMPRTLVDSQAMMVPPIVYDIGGTSEGVRNGESGYVVGVGDVPAMADRVEKLLKDDALRSEMGLRGRTFVEDQFSLESFAKRHESFYQSILQKACVRNKA